MNAAWYKRFNPAGNLLTDSNNLYPGYQARVLVHMIVTHHLPSLILFIAFNKLLWGEIFECLRGSDGILDCFVANAPCDDSGALALSITQLISFS